MKRELSNQKFRGLNVNLAQIRMPSLLEFSGRFIRPRTTLSFADMTPIFKKRLQPYYQKLYADITSPDLWQNS